MGIVVMPGGTSGLGAVAAQQMLREAHKIFLAARKPHNIGPHALLLDLTDLKQVRIFAEEVKRALGKDSIDALVLNAGGYARGRTTEGYDATFVLNHLSHYLLARLLWERMSVGGTVTLTTSGTYDPAERTVVLRGMGTRCGSLGLSSIRIWINQRAQRLLVPTLPQNYVWC